MKKIFIFLVLLFLVTLPKFLRSQDFFPSIFSIIPGIPSMFLGYNPINIGMAGGASLMELIITTCKSKRNLPKPHQSFFTIIQNLEATTKII